MTYSAGVDRVWGALPRMPRKGNKGDFAKTWATHGLTDKDADWLIAALSDLPPDTDRSAIAWLKKVLEHREDNGLKAAEKIEMPYTEDRENGVAAPAVAEAPDAEAPDAETPSAAGQQTAQQPPHVTGRQKTQDVTRLTVLIPERAAAKVKMIAAISGKTLSGLITDWIREAQIPQSNLNDF